MNAAKRTNSENGSVSNTNGTSDEDVVEGLDEYQASPEVGEALMRLRSALEVQHRAIFFCANARFQIKSNTDFTEPDSAEFSALQKLEEEGYETAKGVRREILSENHRKATKAMRKLGNDAASQNFVTIPELIPNPVKGLESATVVEKVEELYGFLNLQANLIDEWREVIVGLLLQPLVDEENETETTGDEFVNSTAIQEQLMNMLVKHETQTTKALAMDGEGPAPKTLIELLDMRNKVKPSLEEHGCLRGAIGELLVNRQIKDIQAQIQAQAKASQRLERECDEFTNAMNLRLDYYQTAHRKLSSAEAKHRYLVSLREGGASKANEPKMCIICQTDFTIGVLTVCGHQFCKQCLMLWFKAHHNCPMCKRKLKITDLHTITLKPRELTLHTEDAPTSTPGKKRSAARNKSAIYSEFGADKLAQIRDVDLEGPPLTTKVDSIVRHLLWLRESDPGAKSIVFSQYRDFLQVIGSALSRSRIGYTSIDKPNGVQRFKEDAGMECFLLHGRAQSSGLNLVNASHVFLCEPLLNTAIELQAIARVDRIGQQHETTVWLYLVEGTVEESIYNLSVKRRLQHLSSVTKGKSKESTPDVLEPTLEAANTFEMENASLSKLMSKDRSAGEAVDKEDLWECLFGHVAKAANSESREERRENPAVMNLLAAEAAESRRMMENASRLET
ncbi:putative ATP-dependent helicase like protein [Verticillium longisporum]|uniref:Putative ATP-dependent helicase like protein n=1 Tax=Verticillium longisporum TaxID=100787 RepID=A0A8I2ZQN2_VERLO|nr:putative ATP-dependent helicase like protein [Verticillium longisporum]